MTGISPEELVVYAPVIQQLESMGLPLMDGLLSMPLDEPDEQKQMQIAKELLGNLPVGITHFILHPSIDTVELRSIAPDWESRVANYNVFMSDDLRMFMENEDVRLIGYRQLRDAMRMG
jgi:chitin disaccharide deacetylase